MSKESEAKAMLKTLCQTLENMSWRYTCDEEKSLVYTSAVGKDLSMKLYVKVDAERGVMYLKSRMPFAIPSDKIRDAALAAVAANWSMLNGSFEMDMDDGYLGFKLVVPFMESLVSEKVCRYMINVSCDMIDKFNDKFQALVQGAMTFDEFVAFAKQ